MIVALAYCHMDIRQALRLMRWSHFLHGEFDAGILLVASRLAARQPEHEDVQAAASTAFTRGVVHVPDGEVERGWPAAPNHLFRETLLAAERLCPGEDVLFIEPDCVIVNPDWFSLIAREWQTAKSNGRVEFMGARVTGPKLHMSGVGVYGAGWRTVLPGLPTLGLARPWDMQLAELIVPRAAFTDLIQHWWKPRLTSLDVLASRTVIFHQDKSHVLMRLLDLERHGGRFFGRPSAPLDPMEKENMSAYFYTINATRPVRVDGWKISFEPVGEQGGVAQGVFSTSDPGQMAVLRARSEDPKSGIREITEDQYRKVSQKKMTKGGRNEYRMPLSDPSLATRPSPVAVEDVASQSPSAEAPPVMPPGQPSFESLAQAAKLGKVGEADPADAAGKLRTKAKAKWPAKSKAKMEET